jgi:two-component system, sensor histidine kinase
MFSLPTLQKFIGNDEALFQRHYLEKALPLVRTTLLFGSILYTSFLAWDYILDHSTMEYKVTIRATIVLMAAITFLLTLLPIGPTLFQIIASSFSSAVGLSVVLILHYTRFGFEYGAGGIILIFMFTCGGFLRLLFIPTCLVSITIVLFTNAAMYATHENHMTIVNDDFFVVSAMVVVWVYSYFLESGERHLFSQNILLDAERANTRKLIEELEGERGRKSDFIAAISHDLRQPLTTIALKLRTIAARIDQPDLSLDIKLLQQQCQTIEHMIEGTLNLSRIEAGTWVVEVRDVALPHVLEKVVGDFKAEAESKNILLELRALPYVVKTDPVALDRVLRNLLGNAIRYTPDVTGAGPRGRVIVECTIRNDSMCIGVIDNGIGIPPHRLTDVFQQYVQLSNPERDHRKGLGLGLSIVKGLVKILNHELEVQSEVGRGSRFVVIVPIAAKIPEELLPGGAKIEDKVDLTGTVVALIEDDEGAREALRDRLVEWGCDVVAGESADDVVRELKEHAMMGNVHFIISDYRLRDGNTGISAIEAIRSAANSQIPAAVWTAETTREALLRIYGSGLTTLSKPPDELKLLALLAAHRFKRDLFSRESL